MNPLSADEARQITLANRPPAQDMDFVNAMKLIREAAKISRDFVGIRLSESSDSDELASRLRAYGYKVFTEHCRETNESWFYAEW